MADARLTMLDIIKRKNTDLVVGLVDEAASLHPEFRIVPARTIKGTQFKTLVRSALPDVGFRAANAGIAITKSTLINRLVECYILDASWNVDKMVADASEDGADAVCADEAAAHMLSGFNALGKQFYYGAASGVTGAAEGFVGLINLLNATDMEVDAAGDASDCTSVWGAVFGRQGVQFVMGRDGVFDEGDINVVPVVVDSKTMHAYDQSLAGWVGMMVANQYAIGRIRDVDVGKPLDDDMMDALMGKFLAKGMRPSAFFMTPRSLLQLKVSRTATNATGAPTVWPDGYHYRDPATGAEIVIPFVITDSILNTETAV